MPPMPLISTVVKPKVTAARMREGWPKRAHLSKISSDTGFWPEMSAEAAAMKA